MRLVFVGGCCFGVGVVCRLALLFAVCWLLVVGCCLWFVMCPCLLLLGVAAVVRCLLVVVVLA